MAAFVSEYEYDFFVSYAHVNNEPRAKENTGWITTLVQELKKELADKLGDDCAKVWRDPKLQGNDDITSEVEHAVTHSASLVVIFSRAYLKSEWCRKELEMFVGAAVSRGANMQAGRCGDGVLPANSRATVDTLVSARSSPMVTVGGNRRHSAQ